MYGNGKRPTGSERYYGIFYGLQKKIIPRMLEGQYVNESGKTIYSLRSKIALKDIMLANNPNSVYGQTEKLLWVIYIASNLIGYDHTLYQPAYELLDFNLHKLEDRKDDIDLPEKEKKEFIAYADQICNDFHKVVPVDYFLTEDGNFDAYE